MTYALLGALGFFILYWFDLAAMKKIRYLKQLIWIASGSLFVYSLVMVCLKSERIWLPRYLYYIGWVSSPIFLLLLIYSLLLEIPFKSTYAYTGAGGKLVTTGTYALVRHPGVIWFTFFLLSLFFITRSKALLIALPIWVFMDVLYVVIQDKFFFVKMFGDEYKKYQMEVPMLIPNGASVRRCIKTLRFRN
jgi:protein-S-isoprenylcysteine O-methyltransferase Ste14